MTNSEFVKIIEKAVAGEQESIEAILLLYMPLIKSKSYIKGLLDEDCMQYIMIKIAQQVPNFKI